MQTSGRIGRSAAGSMSAFARKVSAREAANYFKHAGYA
jgi:hypothetical protein